MIGVLILAACSAAPTPAPEAEATATPTPADATQITPTIDWFPVTATPTYAPTLDATATPDLLTGLGPILLADDFSNQGQWQIGRTTSGNVGYGQGALTLAVSDPKGYVASQRKSPELDNYYLEISAVPSLCKGADAYGLLLRATSAPDYYRFSVTCDGRLRLERVKHGETVVLADWTPRIGPPQPKRLGVWISGPEMRFFIDDIYQFSARDAVLASGLVGVFARSAGDTPLTVNFSDLSVRQISSVILTPSPSSQSTKQPTPNS
jgi:hypothetical protein